MTRATRARAAVALAVAALASPRPALAHGGLPVPILKRQHVGAYDVSVYATPDVGMGMIYVVYLPHDGAGAAFVAPTAVRVGLAPVSGRVGEALYDAHAERVRYGARFVAHVDFDRGEAWRVRVVTDGPTPVGEVTARVAVSPMEMMGPFGLLFFALPFVLVGGLWGGKAFARRRVDRRHAADPRAALPSH